MPEPTFVGREQHIRQFMDLLNSKPGSPYILNLRGQGGIGKTKILQKFIEICDDEGIPHTRIIDFYGIEMSSRISTVAQTIVKSIGEPDKTLFFNEYFKIKKQFDSQPTHSLEQDLQYHFISGLSELAKISSEKGKRIAIIFDTFEAVRYSILENTLLNDWLPKLKEAVLVISGRQEKGEINFPEEISQLLIDAPVDTFSEDEATAYLKERKVWDAIKDDGICLELFKLTQNKPLLLALSADWIFNYAIFPTTTPKDLVRDADQSTFEKKLVQNLPILIETDKPENEILPYMAHVIRPFNKELLVFLKPNISGDDAQKILKNLSELSFVKEVPAIPGEKEDDGPFYWFQDELRKLFYEHIFSVNTIQYNRIRQNVSKRMIEYHDVKIKEAKEKGDILEEQRIIARRLYHEIYLKPVEGMTKWQRMFQETAREKLQYGFASLLLAPVRFIVNYLPNHLPEHQNFMFEIAEGRWMNDMADSVSAEKRFKQLLERWGDNDREKSPYIYNALGATASKMGRFEEALEFNTTSLELSKKFGLDKRFNIEEQNIGEINQHIGNFDNAIKHLKIAYKLRLNQKEWNRVAGSLSSLGRAYGLSGQYEVGINYCNQAIDLLKKLDFKERVAGTKLVRADLYRRVNRYEEALMDIQEAIPVLEGLDYQNLATAYFQLGYVQWYKAVKEEKKDIKLLEESKTSFERCINMLRKYNLVRDLHRALHEVSEVYWLLTLKDQAIASNDEAYQMAVKFHDVYYAVNSLVKKAEYDYEDGKFEIIQRYAKELKYEFEDKGYKFPLFYGRMRRILGDVAFEKRDYNTAINYYAEGLYLISQHGGYGKYTIDNELNILEGKLKTLPDEIALNFYESLKNYWTNKGIDQNNPRMISQIDKNLNNLAFQIQSNLG